MGLLDLFKKRFNTAPSRLEWSEDDKQTLSYRFPMSQQEIRNGAELTVHETQLALFVNEGEVADLFEPGLHSLTDQVLPVLTRLRNQKKGASSFKADLFFFSTREQIDQRWGTPNPIVIRDPEFGPIRLRAHGVYSYRIKNPMIFFKKLSGTKERFTLNELEGQLRSTILTSISSFFGTSSVQFADMAANQTQFSTVLKEALLPAFSDYGLKLESFLVQSLSLPEGLQEAMDQAAARRISGETKK